MEKVRVMSPNFSDKELLEYCQRLATGKAREEVNESLMEISIFYSDWVVWLEASKMLPMISPPFSGMTEVVRAMGYTDKNVAEAHNRRGSLYVDKHSTAEEAIKRLADLDEVDERLLVDNYGKDDAGKSRPPRARKGHTLAPSESRTPTRPNKRRAIGPPKTPAKKRRTGARANATNRDGSGKVRSISLDSPLFNRAY